MQFKLSPKAIFVILIGSIIFVLAFNYANRNKQINAEKIKGAIIPSLDFSGVLTPVLSIKIEYEFTKNIHKFVKKTKLKKEPAATTPFLLMNKI